eukprot:CAMPEP_0197897434 /NCGR_PEP_ID=MMETSP1439-20131203/42183_1 /TAXON_ID=66791 /ORGANISM="Gonyaulax spinifera, Strain CCMP409" /LENGTH=43 /DNA_ID= /DNA_START= /DNA_END= /DNA_ORIENTATION=
MAPLQEPQQGSSAARRAANQNRLDGTLASALYSSCLHLEPHVA